MFRWTRLQITRDGGGRRRLLGRVSSCAQKGQLETSVYLSRIYYNAVTAIMLKEFVLLLMLIYLFVTKNLHSDHDRDNASRYVNKLIDTPSLPSDLENNVVVKKGRGCTGKDMIDISKFSTEEKTEMKACYLKVRSLRCGGKCRCNDLKGDRMCWRVPITASICGVSICGVDIVVACVKTRISRADVYDAAKNNIAS